MAEIIHRAAAPFTAFILLTVIDTENIFGIVCHHSEEGNDPHPEDRTGAAGDDGRRYAGDIAGADRRRKRGAETLELGDGFIFLSGMRRNVLILEDGTDRIGDPVSEMR